MGRRTLGIAAALLALLAVAVGGVLAIESDDEEPRDVASETGTGTAVETGTAGETSPTGTESETPAEPDRTEETELERAPEPDRAPDPEPAPAPAAEPARYTAYSAGSGDWQTVVPSGGGWQQPVEAGQGSARLRVTVRGPRGAVLLIDHTPNAAARFGSNEMNAPAKLRTADSPAATRGESARVAIEVAIALAVSWKPFVKSKASAVTITTTRRRSDSMNPPIPGRARITLG